jgi:CRISPR-associated protein Csm5
MTNISQTIPCAIKVLSPLHIGCDEVYEPMSFVVDEQKAQLVAFDPMTFYPALPQPQLERFRSICARGTIDSILEIYQFLHGKKAQGRPVALAGGFLDHYRKTLSLKPSDKNKLTNELNRFTLSRTSFLPYDGRPYLPGSSVKGALRTAYLNFVAQKKTVPQASYTVTDRKGKPKKDSKRLEKALLDGGSFETDPLRLVKVSDFMPFGQVNSRIIYAVNKKKVAGKYEAQGPYQILEVIEPGAVFVGHITIVADQGSGIKNPITQKALWDCIECFFPGEMKRERLELINSGVTPQDYGPPNGQRFFRLGRHSGAECVTINGYRDIKILKKKGEPPSYRNSATTLWLTSEQPKPGPSQKHSPFGWVIISELDQNEKERLLEEENKFKEEQALLESALPVALSADAVPAGSAPGPAQKPTAPLHSLECETLLRELSVARPTDAGVIGSIIQRIGGIEKPVEQALVAVAVKEKLGERFKKNKQKELLEKIIQDAKAIDDKHQ